MSRLAGKIALVTGGTSGIGLAIARRFQAEGATVLVTGRRTPAPEAPAAGAPITALQADATDAAAMDRVFQHISAHHARLDILVANSGISTPAALEAMAPADFDSIFALNTRAMVFTVQKALPLMPPGAAIVLTGSIAGFKGVPNYGVYAASKAALRSFARSWTPELAPRGIRVNVLSPGPIDTPMFDAVPPDARAGLEAMIPLGRLGRPEEVAAGALFLASGDSSYMAGAELCLDGGMAQV